MFTRTTALIASLGAVAAFAAAAPTSAQDLSPYEQCLADYCWGNYTNDPEHRRLCYEWCADQTGGPQFAPANYAAPLAKLD